MSLSRLVPFDTDSGKAYIDAEKITGVVSVGIQGVTPKPFSRIFFDGNAVVVFGTPEAVMQHISETCRWGRYLPPTTTERDAVPKGAFCKLQNP